MNKLWKKGGQPQQSSQSAVVTPVPTVSTKVPSSTKAVRKAACWGGSSAVGEAEVVSSPTTTKDTIKADYGTTQLVQVLPLR